MNTKELRDWNAEVRVVLEQIRGEGAYSPPQLADELYDKLMSQHPALLDGWLRAGARNWLREMINSIDRSERTALRHYRRAREQADAVAESAAGDYGAVRQFRTRFKIKCANGQVKPLGRCKKEDLLFAADDYAARERENGITKFYLRALAKKIDDKYVDQVYSDEQLSRIYDALEANTPQAD